MSPFCDIRHIVGNHLPIWVEGVLSTRHKSYITIYFIMCQYYFRTFLLPHSPIQFLSSSPATSLILKEDTK